MEPTQPPQVPITPPQQFPQPSTPASASKGWKMPAAITVGVLIIAGGAYAWMQRTPATPVAELTPTTTPTLDPTADWKTYTNTEHGFEFRYPADRTLEGPNISYTSETPRIVSIGLGDMEHPFYNKERFTISVYDPTSQKTIEEGGCRSADNDCISEYRIINGARFLVNTYRVSDGMSSGSQEKNAVIIHDGKLFNFYTGFSGGYYSDMSIPELAAKRILFDQILSTFKFIEPTSAVPADWNTYTNTQYGFEMRYPTNWVVDAPSSDYSILKSEGNKASITIATKNIGTESVFDVRAEPGCSIRTIQFATKSAKECISQLPSLYARDVRLVDVPMSWGVDNEVSGTVNPRDAVLESQLNQILSTFKFTK